MNVSLNWLNNHLDLSAFTTAEISDLLTFSGIEVEDIRQSGVPSELIVVAQIKEAVQHPDADKLKVCQVDAGEGNLRQIVCGAKNYSVGDKVPCALPGADLGEGFVIKEGKLRGVPSLGMLCGASEIGLTDDCGREHEGQANAGLMILPEDSVIGTKLTDLYPGDTIFELEITPNRPDCLSHHGVARELTVLTKKALKEKAIATLSTQNSSDIQLNSDTCPHYTALKISGVKVAPSPEWLSTKLEAIGLRPINNIVDITNYVLHELGHPLHAFDAAKVTLPLDIRNAKAGESFKALDENDYELTETDCLISDSTGVPLALAGIMGGLDSGVSDSTTDIILESAYFTPSNIRRTSRRLNLSSDSSYRFERGTDPLNIERAASLAAQLITELTGGTIKNSLLSAGQPVETSRTIAYTSQDLNRVTDNQIPWINAIETLQTLGINETQDGIWTIPSFRGDLTRPIDLTEEVVRVYGLDNIKATNRATLVPPSKFDQAYDFEISVKQQLAGQGFSEAQTIKLISDEQLATDTLPTRPLMDGDTIRVALPLSTDHTTMRPALSAGLIATAARNVSQGAKSIRFFETGKCFRNSGGGKNEKACNLESQHLGLIIGGQANATQWDNKENKNLDLYDLKAALQSLLPNSPFQFNPRDRDGFLLGADILLNGKSIGSFALLNPARARALDLDFPVYLAELDLTKLQASQGGQNKADPLPQFPGSTRDIAIDAPVDLPNADIEKSLQKLNNALLITADCVDLYTDPSGEKLPADRKSLTYSLLYRSAEKTLKQKDVDEAHATTLAHLEKSLPIAFR